MYEDEYCSMGLRFRFHSYIYLVMLMIGTGGSWVELPVQGRLCPIFCERCRVTRHLRVFLRVDGQSTDPREWGVIGAERARDRMQRAHGRAPQRAIERAVRVTERNVRALCTRLDCYSALCCAMFRSMYMDTVYKHC